MSECVWLKNVCWQVWNIHTGNRLLTLKSHTDGVTCLQFNDEVIVSGSYDKTVKLWDFSSCWPSSLLLIRHANTIYSFFKLFIVTYDENVLCSGTLLQRNHWSCHGHLSSHIAVLGGEGWGFFGYNIETSNL